MSKPRGNRIIRFLSPFVQTKDLSYPSLLLSLPPPWSVFPGSSPLPLDLLLLPLLNLSTRTGFLRRLLLLLVLLGPFSVWLFVRFLQTSVVNRSCSFISWRLVGSPFVEPLLNVASSLPSNSPRCPLRIILNHGRYGYKEIRRSTPFPSFIYQCWVFFLQISFTRLVLDPKVEGFNSFLWGRDFGYDLILFLGVWCIFSAPSSIYSWLLTPVPRIRPGF